MTLLKKLCFVAGCLSAVVCLSVVSGQASAKMSQSSAKKILLDTDFMEGLPLSYSASQVVVGNPSIADIVVRDDKFLFLSGKSPGRTNMLIYDREGTLRGRYVIFVRNANNYMTVYKGAANKSHHDCLPLCERVFRIEDSSDNAGTQSGKIGTALSLIDGRAEKARAMELEEAQRLQQQAQTGIR